MSALQVSKFYSCSEPRLPHFKIKLVGIVSVATKLDSKLNRTSFQMFLLPILTSLSSLIDVRIPCHNLQSQKLKFLNSETNKQTNSGRFFCGEGQVDKCYESHLHSR